MFPKDLVNSTMFIKQFSQRNKQRERMHQERYNYKNALCSDTHSLHFPFLT